MRQAHYLFPNIILVHFAQKTLIFCNSPSRVI